MLLLLWWKEKPSTATVASKTTRPATISIAVLNDADFVMVKLSVSVSVNEDRQRSFLIFFFFLSNDMVMWDGWCLF